MSEGFTERVRQELSRHPLADDDANVVELGLMLRLVGRLHRTGTADGPRTSIEVASPSGGVIRRLYALVQSTSPVRPRLWVREPGGVRTETTYGAVVGDGAIPLGQRAGVLDDHGLPTRGLPPGARDHPGATLRATALCTTSFSRPDRPAHVEIRVPDDQVAAGLLDVLASVGIRAHHDEQRHRLVLKSAASASHLLDLVGATTARDEWDGRRERRDLRNRATRLANADAANVRRTIDAAQDHLDVVEAAVARVGWDGLPEDLRSVALARLVNPTASLADVGALCDPPVGKSAVHRRIQRLSRIAAGDPF